MVVFIVMAIPQSNSTVFVEIIISKNNSITILSAIEVLGEI